MRAGRAPMRRTLARALAIAWLSLLSLALGATIYLFWQLIAIGAAVLAIICIVGLADMITLAAYDTLFPRQKP